MLSAAKRKMQVQRFIRRESHPAQKQNSAPCHKNQMTTVIVVDREQARVYEQRTRTSTPLANASWIVTLPFVIPSEAEGSAVRPGSRTKVSVPLVPPQNRD